MLDNGNTLHAPRLVELIVNMAINKINLKIISIKIPMLCFKDLEKKIQEFMWNNKRSQITRAILWSKTQLEASKHLTSNYTTEL